ncbi:MAG: hypothetical protein HOH43_05675 [Candidatus Latescibacteria bacterium]|nr:hypothetical protein [Candidatus Latescibacterota bacterium]
MGQLLFGLGRRVITPPLGIELCGYGPYRERKGTEVIQDLQCTALALSTAGGTVFIWLSNDLIWLDRSILEETYRLARSAYGLDASRIVITNTHTHSGPATMRTVAWGEWDQAYADTLPSLFVEAIGEAIGNMIPGRIGFSQVPVPELSVNRVEDDGPVEESASLIRIDDMAGVMRAGVVNFSAHPVTLGATSHVCGDYVGDGVAKMEQALNERARILFFQGSCGNLNCRGFGSDIATMKANGSLLMDAILPGLDDVSTFSDVRLSGDSFEVALPMQVPERGSLELELEASDRALADFDGNPDSTVYKNLVYESEWRKLRLELLEGSHPERKEIQVSYLQINDAVLVAHPLELFLEFGNIIREASPFAHTMLVGYANEAVGYLARPQDFRQEGFGWYAAVAAPRLCRHLEFAEEAGQVFCSHITALLHQVFEKME